MKEKRKTAEEQFDLFSHPSWCACDTCYTDDRIPPVSDESWQVVSAPVLEFIHATPATFDEIRTSFKHMPGDLAMNCVAWLSFNDKIDHIDGKWTVL